MADSILNPGACWRPVAAGSWRRELLGDTRPAAADAPRPRPVTRLTSLITSVYSSANPAFRYAHEKRPKNFLTQPSEGVSNNGRDNAEKDLIVHMGEQIFDDTTNTEYRISSLLGRGTFGQVLRARNLKTNECVAIKIIKNERSYYTQSQTEVRMLQLLKSRYRCDKSDGVHVVSLLASFDYQNHLCLVFELLSLNLFELLESNGYKGLTLNTVRPIIKQVLSTLEACGKLGIVHCDLKPENILIVKPPHPNVKVIDFGSACEENNPIFSYIQSRYYRAPEVLLGNHYTSMIDIWSLGCVAAELFLGLPLLPGYNDYNQLHRVIEMIGFPPKHLLDGGSKTAQYFKRYTGGESFDDSDDDDGPPPPRAQLGGKQAPNPPPKILPSHGFKLKSEDEYYADAPNEQRQPFKRYYYYYKLRDIIERYSWPAEIQKCEDLEKKQQLIENEKKARRVFLDFLHGLLHTDPYERWPASVALQHPFMTGEEYQGAGLFHVDVAEPQLAKLKARSQPRNMHAQHLSNSLNAGSTWGMTYASGSMPMGVMPQHSGIGLPSPGVHGSANGLGGSFLGGAESMLTQSPAMQMGFSGGGGMHDLGASMQALSLAHSAAGLPMAMNSAPLGTTVAPFSSSPMPNPGVLGGGNAAGGIPITSMSGAFQSASVGSSAVLGTTPTMGAGKPIPIPGMDAHAQGQSFGGSAPSFVQWMSGGGSLSGPQQAHPLHGSSPNNNNNDSSRSQPMPIGPGGSASNSGSAGASGGGGGGLFRNNSGRRQCGGGGGGGYKGGGGNQHGGGKRYDTPPHGGPFSTPQGNSPGQFSGSSPGMKPPMYSQPMLFQQRSTHSTPGGGSTPTSSHYLSPGGSYQAFPPGMHGQPQHMHSGTHPHPKVVPGQGVPHMQGGNPVAMGGGQMQAGYPMHPQHAPQQQNTGRSPSSYDGWTDNVPWEDGN